MIEYISGKNILDSTTYYIVCPTNCRGIFGAGLAKQFVERFPWLHKDYNHHLKSGFIYPGSVMIYNYSNISPNGKVVICIPTKDDWRNPSREAWIDRGLNNLQLSATCLCWNKVSLPKLGCGLGGLLWKEIKPLYEFHLRKTGILYEVHI